MAERFIYQEYAGYRCLCGMEKQTTDLYLTYCGMEQCTPTHFCGPINRPEYHIHFILDGEGYLELKGEKYHLHKGQIFLLPAQVSVYYYANPSHPWYYAWAAFNGKKAAYYLSKAGFSNDLVVRDCIFPPEDYAAVINKMLLANELSVKDELIRIGCLFHLFAMLIRSTNCSSGSLSSNDLAIQHALQYMEYNYNNDIQISGIADYIGLNRTFFTNLFKKKMHISPKSYLTKLRMDKACELLVKTHEPIQDISLKVGYSDPFAFSKMFHQIVGKSPTDFRKNQSNSKNES